LVEEKSKYVKKQALAEVRERTRKNNGLIMIADHNRHFQMTLEEPEEHSYISE
jgi:hypothetical protein